MQYAIPKGVFDIFPEESQPEDAWRSSVRWQYVEEKMRNLAHDYQCLEVRTPIFEKTELFIRGVGESSDIVSKEMYTFLDKGERSMTLRPEGTAPVVRAFVEKKLHTQKPLHKLYYIGPMFRYDRPQAGRYRQFHQFGVEMIGCASAEQDVELIDMACELYRRLGLKELKVMINTVGDKESRETYRLALKEYFLSYLPSLSEDSQIRFEKNVLRILDSKSPEDQAIVANAPPIQEFLSSSARKHFDTVCTLLSDIGLTWQINSRLVRGLDYYNHTVFEVTSSLLGSQNALGGGGRYDGLVSMIGGPDVPSVGFATGIERILQAMQKQNVPFPSAQGPFVYFIGLGDTARLHILRIVTSLRHRGIPVDMELIGKKIQQALQMADLAKAHYVLVLGEDELRSGQAVLKEMATRQTTPILLNDLQTQIVHLYQQKKAYP
ncbi:MAG: histidine--tRNA ligase [Simkania sp.]|nr:histidine--tRNA ligase [Simkania sp.]